MRIDEYQNLGVTEKNFKIKFDPNHTCLEINLPFSTFSDPLNMRKNKETETRKESM
jgi:hypothetical protein